MTMNSMTITNLYEFFPFLKATVTSVKPIPDLHCLDGERSLILPDIKLWHSIFIVGQTEFTIELLMIKNGRRRIMSGIYDSSYLVDYLKSFGLKSEDFTHMERIGVTLSDMLQLLDRAREYQDSAMYMKKLVDTMDYIQHYPPEVYEDSPPIHIPNRLSDLIRSAPSSVIEIVMNDTNQLELERIIMGIVLKNNLFRGQWVTGHYRKMITNYTSISTLIEFFSQNYKDRLDEHLLILELEIDPNTVFMKSFLNLQLIPYLKEVIKESVVILINHSQVSLLFDELPLNTFYFHAGLS
jgi:hypothetical protein